MYYGDITVEFSAGDIWYVCRRRCPQVGSVPRGLVFIEIIIIFNSSGSRGDTNNIIPSVLTAAARRPPNVCVD